MTRSKPYVAKKTSCADCGLPCDHRVDVCYKCSRLRMTVSPSERFWSKVEKTDGCWLWTGYIDPAGYGNFQLADGKPVRAHRFAYEDVIGPIPEGLHLDHVREKGCTNRSCVRPDHLEPVTQEVNNERSMSLGAVAQRTNRCSKGHEYVPGSFKLKGTWRICLICRDEYAKRYQKKNRETINAAKRRARRRKHDE